MMKLEVKILNETKLLFGHDQKDDFAKDGLLLYGPPTDKHQPKEIRYGLIATTYGAQLFRDWLNSVNSYIPSADESKPHHLYWPGFQAVFRAEWQDPVAEYHVKKSVLSKFIRNPDRHHAIYDVASELISPIETHLNEEDQVPDVWFIVEPDELFKYGRPKSSVPVHKRELPDSPTLGKAGAKRHQHMDDLFGGFDDQLIKYDYSLNLHAQIKSRLLGKAVVQVVRESTLSGGDYIEDNEIQTRKLQDPASVAWNICATSYFKAQGSPWQLADVRPGVCYVGLVFKKRSDVSSKEVCCGAQMFLTNGDGVVFRGASGNWQVSKRGEFHLDEHTANDLLTSILHSYKNKFGEFPLEIFLHARTSFNADEWSGFSRASSEISPSTNLVAVKIRKTNKLKVFRAGKMPLARGSYLQTTEREAYVWTSGYIPRLQTYPGWEVPNPLMVRVERGNADLVTVLRDVFALTKLNFNSCSYGDGVPVTLKFADAVGDILTASDKHTDGQPLPFKYYI